MLTPAAALPRETERARRAAWGWTAVATLLLLAPVPASVAEAAEGWRAFHWDKLVHMALFFFLVRSWLRVFGASGRRTLAVALAAVAYGGLVELAQAGLAGRVAEVGDLAADALGAALACLRRR